MKEEEEEEEKGERVRCKVHASDTFHLSNPRDLRGRYNDVAVHIYLARMCGPRSSPRFGKLDLFQNPQILQPQNKSIRHTHRHTKRKENELFGCGIATSEAQLSAEQRKSFDSSPRARAVIPANAAPGEPSAWPSQAHKDTPCSTGESFVSVKASVTIYKCTSSWILHLYKDSTFFVHLSTSF